jgi:thymidylate kinase
MKMMDTTNNHINSDRMKWIEFFRQANINYCILRDIKSCLQGHPPLEIDILIDSDHFPNVREILFRAGYVLRSDWTEYPHFEFYLYKGTGLVSILDIVIDLRVARSGKIFRTLNPKVVISNCKAVDGLNIVSNDDELVLLLLHTLIDKGFLLEKHRLRLEELLQVPECRINAENKLSSIIGDKITAGKIFEFISKKDFDNFFNMKYTIFKWLFLNASMNDKKKVIVQLLQLECHRFLSLLFKKNKCMLCPVIGIDGAGKSTFIKKFSHIYSINRNIVPCRLGYGAQRNYYFRLTYSLCPIDDNVRIEKERKNIEDRKNFSRRFWIDQNMIITYILNKRKFRRVLPYVIDSLFYLEDLIAINKCKRKAGKNGLVLTDRSAIDRIVILISQGQKVPWIYRFLYITIYPHPNLIIFLDCGPEMAVKRKGELTMKDAKNQTDSYIYFLTYLYTAPSIKLNSSSAINEMVDIILSALNLSKGNINNEF